MIDYTDLNEKMRPTWNWALLRARERNSELFTPKITQDDESGVQEAENAPTGLESSINGITDGN